MAITQPRHLKSILQWSYFPSPSINMTQGTALIPLFNALPTPPFRQPSTFFHSSSILPHIEGPPVSHPHFFFLFSCCPEWRVIESAEKCMSGNNQLRRSQCGQRAVRQDKRSAREIKPERRRTGTARTTPNTCYSVPTITLTSAFVLRLHIPGVSIG